MILIALGSNLPGRHGPPLKTLIAARQALRDRKIEVIASSRVWLTAPVPLTDHPWYHNAVLHVDTKMNPHELLACLNEIEQDFGRVRGERYAPRILDLDLAAYDDEVIDTPKLVVPHPRLHERAFVLLPLRDIEPRWIHPKLGYSLQSLISALPLEEQEGRALPPDEDWL